MPLGKNDKVTIIFFVIVLFVTLTSCSKSDLQFTETSAIPPSNYNGQNAGSLKNPFLISNLANLRWLSESLDVWGSDSLQFHFLQTDNIDAFETIRWNGGAGFTPIGMSRSLSESLDNHDKYFYGSYNGNSKSIENLYVGYLESEENISSGLFGSVNCANISNIKLNNYSSNSREITGTLIGYAIDSSIENCSVSGSVNSMSKTHLIGGFVGISNKSKISRCSSTVDILRYKENNKEGSTFTGGIVAGMQHSSLENSFFRGRIKGNAILFGGLVGTASNSDILNCYADITQRRPKFSGLAVSLLDSKVENCFYFTVSLASHSLFLKTDGISSVSGGKLSRRHRHNKSFYIDMGWDFTTTWNIDKKINDGYPSLLLGSCCN